MSKWAAHVKGFEPHPELATFAQRMLSGRAQIHATAVSDYVGHGRFRVPYPTLFTLGRVDAASCCVRRQTDTRWRYEALS
jgi:hypothetical protein